VQGGRITAIGRAVLLGGRCVEVAIAKRSVLAPGVFCRLLQLLVGVQYEVTAWQRGRGRACIVVHFKTQADRAAAALTQRDGYGRHLSYPVRPSLNVARLRLSVHSLRVPRSSVQAQRPVRGEGRTTDWRL
jgi:hypothetical protein